MFAQLCRYFSCCFPREPFPGPRERIFVRPDPTKIPKWEETKPFVPPVYLGICIKVYDGDTITVAAKLPYEASPLYRFQVRLAWIDCPEIKSKLPEEKALAELARDELAKYVLNRPVELVNVQQEKYGRLLAEVYCIDPESGRRIQMNGHLLGKQLAVPYDGGTKTGPETWIEKYSLLQHDAP